ncbi:Atu4866 domain-containing protein [Bogoriella caseilytica]|nr:Atu4866 domain-containing protein [Bogoriella caseilytica]
MTSHPASAPAGRMAVRAASDPSPPVPSPAATTLITGAQVWRPAYIIREDLHLAGERLTASLTEPASEVVDAGGTYAVPLMVDTIVNQLPPQHRRSYDLLPGNLATFAVVHRPVSASQVRSMLVVSPADLLGVWVSGQLEAWQGEPTRSAGEDLADPAVRSAWTGAWRDARRDLVQHLLPDGRYSETRGGRRDAYTGRYWVHGTRITYFDDSGFWAFGELVDGVLHHAGFVMVRH